jgi:hypothetical protein
MKTIFILYILWHSGSSVVSTHEIGRFDSKDVCKKALNENMTRYSNPTDNEKARKARARQWGRFTRVTFTCVKTGVDAKEPMIFYQRRREWKA